MKFLARTTISLLLLIAGGLGCIHAFETSAYAPTSVLSSGRWVKVSVSETGLHLITLSDLRSMGFSDPSRVRVYGYGGRRLPDTLTRSSYTDDLPLVQSAVTSRGVVFYAVGVDTEIQASRNSLYYYHSLNPFSTKGYYFITESDTPLREIVSEGLEPVAAGTVTSFIEATRHERDLFSPAESGHLLLGEDFRLTRNQTFTFQLPGRVEGTDVWVQADLYGKVTSANATFTLSANGSQISPSTLDRIRVTEEYGDSCRIRKTFPLQGTSLNLGISASATGGVNILALDNISVCYTRSLSLPSAGTLEFVIPSGSPQLSGATAATHVWDVTDPSAITAVRTTPRGDAVAWTSEYSGRRRYVAWNENASLPSPAVVSRVANQDLHGLETPEMVIVTHPDLETQSRRIAEMHRSSADSLSVLVVTPEKIYNEFGSGTPDINAIRRMLKMFYDRGPSTPGKKLKYVLLMGAVTYDQRALTNVGRTGTYVPIWQADQALSENTSFCSDDPIGFLEDNSGILNGSDRLNVAIGRIPAADAIAAKVFTDRLISYCTKPQGGIWRNRVTLLADDEDNAIHLDQTETVEAAMRSDFPGQNLSYNKVYLDTYEKIGGITEVGRTKLHNLLNDGTVWFNYIGHASMTALSGEGIMTLVDLGSLYLRRPPFFYGATCSFAQLDNSSMSGLEMLLMNDSGGFIGGISAVRPVYITRNGVLSEAMGREVFAADEADGRIRPVAEAMRRAKNRVGTDSNKLRYIALCDPAMRLAIPSNYVRLTSIDGNPVGDIDENPVTIPALSRTSLSGIVTDPAGNLMEDFNGTVSLTLFDAERSFTTLGRGEGQQKVYDEQGDRIYAGNASVKGGRWETSIVLSADIADNYRPATLMMYGEASEATMSAGGADRSFYVYGLADDAIADDRAPVIESIFLNHETFEAGGTVNSTPMLIARVSDDTGFNLSTTGIGHEMSVRIDDTINLTDVSTYFTPDTDGTPAGDIVYQLPELSAGNHTARLKVWDIGGNSTTSTVEFFVDPSAAPKIFDMYSDANPAVTEANFYIIHNRPEAMLSVTVEVFDLGGSRLWSSSTSGRADMYASQPVTWNLTNSTGQRVGRGIYLYRATVTSTDNGAASTMNKRIAVAGL